MNPKSLRTEQVMHETNLFPQWNNHVRRFIELIDVAIQNDLKLIKI